MSFPRCRWLGTNLVSTVVLASAVGLLAALLLTVPAGALGGQTTLAAPASAGATNIKVASVSSMTPGVALIVDSAGSPETVTATAVGTAASTATTLAAASSVGATNIKVTSVTGFTVGHQVSIDAGANNEVGTIASVGTAGSGGTGVTLTAPLTNAHASGVPVQDLGTGITLAAALTIAHASGAPARDLGTGVTFTPALASAHPLGATVSVVDVTALKAAVTGVGPDKNLANEVKKIQGYVVANDKADACKELKALVKQVNLLAAGKKISAAQAASATAEANNVSKTLGC